MTAISGVPGRLGWSKITVGFLARFLTTRGQRSSRHRGCYRFPGRRIGLGRLRIRLGVLIRLLDQNALSGHASGFQKVRRLGLRGPAAPALGLADLRRSLFATLVRLRGLGVQLADAGLDLALLFRVVAIHESGVL